MVSSSNAFHYLFDCQLCYCRRLPGFAITVEIPESNCRPSLAQLFAISAGLAYDPALYYEVQLRRMQTHDCDSALMLQ
jgi:hypothetical protein